VTKFTREQLLAHYNEEVPDLLGRDLRLLIVGINPGLWTAATQTHFSYPGNKFYPALWKAGLLEWEIDRSAGMTANDREMFVGRGMGISNMVARATARADELSKDEIRAGGERLARLVTERKPKVVAVAGLGAYRTAFGRPKAKKGVQDDQLAGATVFLLGNPSGLNAHETVDTLAKQFQEAADLAGVTQV
jgi:TDG/mug DNA glycosylase family protein